MTPSRLAAQADPEPEPEPVTRTPADRVPGEPKLSEKQRERLERLMAAVKSEFQNLLEEEKQKPQG
jgi:hypothetical protein